MPMFANSDIHTPIQAIYARAIGRVTLSSHARLTLRGSRMHFLAAGTWLGYDGQNVG